MNFYSICAREVISYFGGDITKERCSKISKSGGELGEYNFF